MMLSKITLIRKSYIRIVFLSIILLIPFLTFGNIRIDSIKIGGIKLKLDQQELLEKANLGLYYLFTQQVTIYGKPVIVNDTLLLAIGNTTSVFLDPYYKYNLEVARKARISRSLKTRKVETTHEWVDDLLDYINATSDYVEENIGDPVQIYKDRSKGTVTSVYNAFVDNFLTVQKPTEFQYWQMTEETDTVFGYLCQKAVIDYGGRNYSAWFTTEIPINDGPWKFHSLPGLILKVSDNEGYFQYLAIGLQQYEGNVEIMQDKVEYEKVSLGDFNKFISAEKGKNRVSFYHNGQLYMTFKRNPITFQAMELK